MADELHVANHDFFMYKPLNDLVIVGQRVNITARSITKDLNDESVEEGRTQEIIEDIKGKRAMLTLPTHNSGLTYSSKMFLKRK